MSLSAPVLPLADIEDFIGIILFVVFGLISYCFEYLKRQKQEAATRRAMQEEFRKRGERSVSAPPMSTCTPAQKATAGRTSFDVETEARQRMQSRAKKKPVLSCMDPQDNLELSLSDAELDAIKALQSGKALEPTAPIPGRRQLTAYRNESFSPVKLNATTLRQAVIYKEILDHPRALREYTWK